MSGYSIGSRHGLIMLLCCLIPLAAIFLVSVFSIPLDSLGTVALILLCPLLHIFMMKGMGGHHAQGEAECHESKQAPKQVATGSGSNQA